MSETEHPVKLRATEDEIAEGNTASSLPLHDLHNHTIYSGHADADATVLNLITKANSMGLGHIGISEHVMDEEDVEDFFHVASEASTFESMGAKVLLGVEMDIDPHDPDGGMVMPELPCDYVILSAHGFPQFDLELPESERLLPRPQQRQHLVEKWLAWYRKAIDRGGFHILGHPLREPIVMDLLNLPEPDVLAECVDIFRPAIQRGVAFELNEALLNALAPTPHLEAYLELICRLRNLGMKFSRGSDSHGLAKMGASDAIAMAAREAKLTAADWIDAAAFEGNVFR